MGTGGRLFLLAPFSCVGQQREEAQNDMVDWEGVYNCLNIVVISYFSVRHLSPVKNVTQVRC